MSESSVLDNLRQQILIKVGLNLISPSDCKGISLAIQKQVNKNVSETTIKRLFGFAATKTKFSQFTINALKEFVSGADGPVLVAPMSSNSTTELQQIANRVQQITNATLQNVKSRCSVPWELTIARRFAINDFHYFYESDYSFTAFISQPGYGKTILLSHLVYAITTNAELKFRNDLVGYFNVNYIFEPDNQHLNLEDTIKQRIGLPPEVSLIKYFETHYQETNTRFILILDGFSELVLDRYSKVKIFNRIIDFISSINDSNAIKLVLSMRSTMWSRFFERIRHAHFLKNKWFPGSYYYSDYNSNVPPLSEKELELVIEKMNPGEFKKINTNLKSQLAFPFHIQWYYKLKEAYPSFNSYTNITFYEIIDLFIREKIFNTNYATEKLFFLKQIVKLTQLSKKGNNLVKTDLMDHISVYKNAYQELLADGILMEERLSDNGYPVEYVRFLHPHIFEYFLFIELLALHHQNMDKNFFKYIQQQYMGNEVRFQLFQWSVRQLIILENFKDIGNLFTLDLTHFEKNYLIYFIAENLKYRCLQQPNLREKIKEQHLHKVLIQELIHFDFVDSCYKDAISCLLETVDTPENAQIYHSILAIIDCLSLNVDKLSIRLKKIEPLKSKLPITKVTTFEMINLIYLKLQGITVADDNEILLKFESLKKNEIDINESKKAFPPLENFIEYLLIIILNVFYGTPEDQVQIINCILNSYPKLINSKTPLSLYLLNILAISNARRPFSKKTDQMERIISNLYENKERKKPTLYSLSLLLILKAYQSKNKKDFGTAITLTEEAMVIFKRNDLFLYILWMYNLMIEIYTEINQIEKANQYNYSKLEQLEEKGLSHLSLSYIESNRTK